MNGAFQKYRTHPQPLSLSPHAHAQRGVQGQVPSVRCSRDGERGFSRRDALWQGVCRVDYVTSAISQNKYCIFQ